MDYFKCFWLENSQEKVTNMTEKSWLRRKFDRKVMTPLELWPKNLWPRWNFDRINFDPVSDYSEKKSWPRMWSARPHILINIGQPSHPINASISMFSYQAISGTVGCTSRYARYTHLFRLPRLVCTDRGMCTRECQFWCDVWNIRPFKNRFQA